MKPPKMYRLLVRVFARFHIKVTNGIQFIPQESQVVGRIRSVDTSKAYFFRSEEGVG